MRSHLRRFLILFGLLLWFIPFSAYSQAKRGRDLDIGMIINVSAEDAALSGPFHDSLLKTFQDSYGRRLVEITLKDQATLNVESSAYLDSLYFSGANNLLDQFIEISGSGALSLPEKVKRGEEISYRFSGRVRIIDVSRLALIQDQKLEFSGKDEIGDQSTSNPQKLGFDFLTQALIRKMIPFYNPNLMEKLNVMKVGDYFYAKKDCIRALPIYEKALKTAYSFDVTDLLHKRLKECQQLGDIQQRLQAGYKLDLKFQNVGEMYQGYFQKALKEGGFFEHFKQYSDKPVTIRVTYDQAKAGGVPGEFLLTLFYDPKRFNLPVRLPSSTGNASDTKYALNFSPLNGAIIHFLNFRYLALQPMSKVHKELYSQFTTRVQLEKATGDWITFNVSLDRDKNVLAPTKLLVAVKGYKEEEIDQGDPALSKKNIFVLKTPFTPDGKETVDIVTYRYFDLKP